MFFFPVIVNVQLPSFFRVINRDFSVELSFADSMTYASLRDDVRTGIQNQCNSLMSTASQNIVCDVINVVFTNGSVGVDVDYVLNIDFPADQQSSAASVIVELFNAIVRAAEGGTLLADGLQVDASSVVVGASKLKKIKPIKFCFNFLTQLRYF